MNDQKKSLEEKWATWIIGLSIVTFLICGSTIAVLNLKCKVPIVQHKVVFATDTLGREMYSRSQVDSLIFILQDQERALSQKYQFILEERKKDDESKTLITFIVGAIISVCGFFGYKSFKDIKDHGEKIAENKAVETAKNIIMAQLPSMMDNEMTKIYKGQSIEVIKLSLSQELTATLEKYIDTTLAEKAEDMKKEIIEGINTRVDLDESEKSKPDTTSTIIDDSILFE